MKKSIRDMDLKGKRVLVRVDFNVPLKEGKVDDDNRITMTIPTIKYLQEQGAKIILMSHLGRPKGEVKKELSLQPVAERLSELMDQPILFLGEDQVVNEKVQKKVDELKNGDIALLENLRFDIGEEKNHPDFAKKLASLGDVFINDAFGTAHRAHASNVGVAKLLPSAVGFLIEKELDYLKAALEKPKRPFIAIMGGAKVSDKIGVIQALLDRVDEIIIVGGMSYTFLKSQGYEIGTSLLEEDKISLAKELLEKAKIKGVQVLLPKDVVITEDISEEAKGQVVSIEEIPKDKMALDIGPKTLQKIEEALKKAKTVVWNGPAGVFELPEFSKGTFGIGKILASIDATVIIGGGDSASAIEKAGLREKMDHISTGGGASLEMLEGKVLPGIEAIEER